MNVTKNTLNSVMEFDHVIRVNSDGSVSEVTGVYAPELIDDEISEPWELMTGYTGQYGYRGPIMHESEYIRGRMAADILSTPGLYVALVAHTTDHTDHACPLAEDCELDITGWAVATIPAE